MFKGERITTALLGVTALVDSPPTLFVLPKDMPIIRFRKAAPNASDFVGQPLFDRRWTRDHSGVRRGGIEGRLVSRTPGSDNEGISIIPA